MKKIVVILICLFICLNADAKQLKFAQVSDVNYPLTGSSNQVMEWAVRSLNLKNPEFVVFLGNNVSKSKEKNVIDFLQELKPLKMPYYIVCGNSDAHEMSGLKKEEFWNIVKKYNKNNKSKSDYYSFSLDRNILGVVLDGAVPFMQNSHGIYPEEQLKWLDKILSKNKNKKVMIFQHFPIAEPYENYSLSVLNKKEYQDIIDKHNNVISISSGHYGVSKTIIDEKGIYHISSPALYKPNYAYDIITVDYNKIPFSKVKINKIEVNTVELQ